MEKIGEGSFSVVFRAFDEVTKEMVAVKVDKAGPTKRKMAAAEALKLQDLQESEYVPKVHASGWTPGCGYYVMELLGPSLKRFVSKHVMEHRQLLPMRKALELGISMIRAVESLHDLEYVHRDLKPDNFAFGMEGSANQDKLYIIDFGLARKYIDDNGEFCPEIDQFCGNMRYASVNALLRKGHGRCDDLWSVFFIMLEFAKGPLPWSTVNRSELAAVKQRSIGPELVSGLPPEFGLIMEHLQTLKYEDLPDYEYMVQLLQDCLSKLDE